MILPASSTPTSLRCPVCESANPTISVKKSEIQYFSCGNCDVIFTETIDPDIIQTHNSNPDGRAETEIQHVRMQRIMHTMRRVPDKILDFGCGRGDYIDYLASIGIQALGVDQNTQLQLVDVPAKSIDVINMVEVIEHLGDPAKIFTEFVRILRPDGLIYIETSFVDFIGDPLESEYVDPRIGHCCIHSQRSIAYLGKKFKLQPLWLNTSVIIFKMNPLPIVKIV